MIYYEFTPETTEIPARLELIADTPEELVEERLSLVKHALGRNEQHDERDIQKDEIDDLLTADSSNMPILTMSKIECETIIDTSTNMRMLMPETEAGSPRQEIYSRDEWDEPSHNLPSALIAKEALSLILSRDCDDLGLTAQIIKESGGKTEITLHDTYGHRDKDGTFTPVVTVLAEEHPVLQSIEHSTPLAA